MSTTKTSTETSAPSTTPSRSAKPLALTPGMVTAQIFCGVVSYTIVTAALAFDDADEALAFYGVYHREARNQLIHFFGVPGILWSMCIFMVHVRVPILANKLQSVLPEKYPLTYGMALSTFYLVFYLQIDPLGGSLYAPLLWVSYTSSVAMRERDQKAAVAAGGTAPWYGTGRLLGFALFIHVLSWYLQIHLGHRVFEGAQPASLQSLGGALTVAPLFAFYEGLWLIGINQQLQNSTLALVDQYTQEICSEGKIYMRVCETLASASS